MSRDTLFSPIPASFLSRSIGLSVGVGGVGDASTIASGISTTIPYNTMQYHTNTKERHYFYRMHKLVSKTESTVLPSKISSSELSFIDCSDIDFFTNLEACCSILKIVSSLRTSSAAGTELEEEDGDAAFACICCRCIIAAKADLYADADEAPHRLTSVDVECDIDDASTTLVPSLASTVAEAEAAFSADTRGTADSNSVAFVSPRTSAHTG